MNKSEIILLPSENENPIPVLEVSEMFMPTLIIVLVTSLILSVVIKTVEGFLPVKATTFPTIFLLLTANLIMFFMFYLMIHK